MLVVSQECVALLAREFPELLCSLQNSGGPAQAVGHSCLQGLDSHLSRSLLKGAACKQGKTSADDLWDGRSSDASFEAIRIQNSNAKYGQG